MRVSVGASWQLLLDAQFCGSLDLEIRNDLEKQKQSALFKVSEQNLFINCLIALGFFQGGLYIREGLNKITNKS